MLYKIKYYLLKMANQPLESDETFGAFITIPRSEILELTTGNEWALSSQPICAPNVKEALWGEGNNGDNAKNGKLIKIWFSQSRDYPVRVVGCSAAFKEALFDVKKWNIKIHKMLSQKRKDWVVHILMVQNRLRNIEGAVCLNWDVWYIILSMLQQWELGN